VLSSCARPTDPFRNRIETLNSLEPSSSAEEPQVPATVLAQTAKKPGPKGPRPKVIAAVVQMKQRNPTWGCPRIAQQIALAFDLQINKDVVRRIFGDCVNRPWEKQVAVLARSLPECIPAASPRTYGSLI
jgi:hypothetical protein